MVATRGLRQPPHGCLVGLAHRRIIHVPGGLLPSVTPQRQKKSGTLQSGRCILMLPRCLCTQLSRCGRRTSSRASLLFSLEKQLFTPRALSLCPEHQRLGGAASVAVGPADLILDHECGNETARPPVPYCAVHDLWHGIVTPDVYQERCQRAVVGGDWPYCRCHIGRTIATNWGHGCCLHV